ncbi:hypothetical protein BPAE_0280g00080 [Botrytis paeoniae]|uniref:DNA2/NAM7 helicase-like C-terminal domain-containing protein n=1 Tax=Botrytis paeoniae TaxID=278948 RepID=A0A4Z1FGM5_9HELO|nr:hypothetical protein BPAE_0280g00080 [Botrytis paeoniae]
MFVNVKNGESAPKPGSQSQLNHANINAIADMIMSIMKHQPFFGLAPLPFDKISIFTPYKVENRELVNQVKMGVRHVWGDEVGRFPLYTTIDSTQGGQNEIILLSSTPPNKTNGSKIGFLKEWNRMNVALTRAQSTLFTFENLDLWRSQLSVLVKGMRCKKLGLSIMNFLDYGYIIDIDGDNTLPASLEELPDHKTWSKTIISVTAANSKISKAFYAIKNEYEDKEKLAELKKSLWTENRKIREHGKAQREKFRLGEAIEAPLRVQRDGEKYCDKEDVDSDDDDEAPEVKDKDGDFEMDANRMLTEVELAEMEEAVVESILQTFLQI